MSDDAPVAILDFGTNTTRLLITNGTSVDIRVHRVTGLGRGLGKTGRLNEQGIGRVLDAVDELMLIKNNMRIPN